MKKNLLDLFSGTHSVGNVAKDEYNVVSLDRDLKADIMEDIMTWNYKIYPKNHFYIITASPVCLYWSKLRNCWIGRKCRAIHPTETITKDHILNDIKKYGEPMVDKIFEIIEYFEPKYYWIENPYTGKMKEYIEKKYKKYNIYYDVDYCKYSEWGYKKKTRFWTNIKDFKPKICKNDCNNIIIENGKKQHKLVLGNGYEIINGIKTLVNTKEKRDKLRESKKIRKKLIMSVKLERYRIPELLIKELLEKCI